MEQRPASLVTANSNLESSMMSSARTTLALACAIGAFGINGNHEASAQSIRQPAVLAVAANMVSIALSTVPVVTQPKKSTFSGEAVVVANAPYGYAIGRITTGSKFKIIKLTTAHDAAYGLAGDRLCGWVEPAVLNKQIVTTINGPCKKLLPKIQFRSNIGKGFNCPKNACTSGTFATPLVAKCNTNAFYNYSSDKLSFNNILHKKHKTGFRDFAGHIDPKTKVHYRYTTLDDKAAVVSIDNKGWVFMHKSCIAGYPKGGMKK
ncbi:MAG: hypothetical protein NVS1B10_05970 [Candidatus Saccharimonadales bacterium]